MKLVNLTPHVINIHTPSGEVVTIQPEPTSARVTSSPDGEEVEVDGIKLLPPQKWGEVEGLPPPEAGVFFIVSAIVADHAAVRGDLLIPATGPKDGAVRKDGAVVGVTALRRARWDLQWCEYCNGSDDDPGTFRGPKCPSCGC